MALTGTFEELTNLFIFAGWIFYGLAVIALFPHAPHRAQPPPPLPAAGANPWVPGIFSRRRASPNRKYLDQQPSPLPP